MTALEVLDRELARLHEELASFENISEEYLDVLHELSRLIGLLIQLALKEADAKKVQ